MAWSAPRTWSVGEVVTAGILNTHIRDNLSYLKGLDGPITLDDALTIGATGTAKTLNIFGNADVTANGPIVVKNTSAGTIGTALTLDASGASGGRKFSFISTASAASVAGAFALYDSTAGQYRMAIDSTGNVALGGAFVPVGPLHVKGVGGGMIYLSATTVSGTLQTLAPAGTVLTGAVFFVSDVNNGTTNPGGFTVAVQKGGPSVTYTNTDTIALTVSAAGAITIQRTAGTNTHQFNALCLYY